MSYFDKFPKIIYTLDDYRTGQVVPDILRRVTMFSEIVNNTAFYDEYDIKEGETPEIVADRFYNEPTLHWVILHVNNIIDPRFDWPLSQYDLKTFCEGKYTNIDAVHHYEDANGNTVNSNAVNAAAISNFTYEDRLNESKRRIKVVKAELISTIVSEFESIINT